MRNISALIPRRPSSIRIAAIFVSCSSVPGKRRTSSTSNRSGRTARSPRQSRPSLHCAIYSPTRPKIKVAHNAKFDAKWVRHHLGTEVNGIFDTFLASQLIAAGDSDRRHSLGRRRTVFHRNRARQDRTDQRLERRAFAIADRVRRTRRRDHASASRSDGRAAQVGRSRSGSPNLEFECVAPIAEMELNGFYLDETRWREQLDRVTVAQAKAADELQDMLSAGVAQATLFGRAEINLDSQQQVTDALLNLGVPVPDTTRAWQLQPLADKYPVVGEASRIPGGRKVDVELWREHSRVHRAEDRTHPCRLSSDRRTDRTLLVLEPEPPADPARGAISPLLSRHRKDASSSSPITRRSSCGSLPTLPMTRTSSRRLFRARTFTRSTASQVFGVAPADVIGRSAVVCETSELRDRLRHRCFAFRNDDRTFAKRRREYDAAILSEPTAVSTPISDSQVRMS